jgi:tripartite-type tricarboxylate transporter receptor subunit TctC
MHWTLVAGVLTLGTSQAPRHLETEGIAMTRVQRSLSLLAGLMLSAGVALAQTWPVKPVNLMVPYPAGGPSDAIARIFFNPLGKELGQQVLVENLGGVSGALAAQKVLAAPNDGYYVFQGSPNEVILSPLANAAVKLKAEDFRLVHPVADAVMVFVTRKDLGVNTVDELIALARKSADKPLTYGSVGMGSLYHLILENVQASSWRTCPTRAMRRCCRTSPAARSTLRCWSTAQAWAPWATRAG